jgi:hypothetical protein
MADSYVENEPQNNNNGNLINNSNTNNGNNEGNDNIVPFIQNEMGGNFSDNFSFLDNQAGPLSHNFTFLDGVGNDEKKTME